MLKSQITRLRPSTSISHFATCCKMKGRQLVAQLMVWIGIASWRPYKVAAMGKGNSCGSTDVIIVGAGMSGLAAAKELKANNVSFRIIESTNRVGGRVSSVRPPNFDGILIEEGANWIYKFGNGEDVNPIYAYAKKKGLTMTLNNIRSSRMYQYDGSDGSKVKKATRVSQFRVNRRWRKIDRAIHCLGDKAEALYEDKPVKDEGAIKVLGNDCKWNSSSNVDYAIQWTYLDWEFTRKDTSLVNFPYADYLLENPQQMYYVAHQDGGFESLISDFATEEGISPAFIDFNQRVTHINYDYAGHPEYKVKIHVSRASSENVTKSNSTCMHYLAKYVILTVPVGVFEHKLIKFQPPLFTEDVPLAMGQYAKIYYKFNFRVGRNYKNEFLFALLQGSKSADNNDHCMHWQNMDAVRKGSFFRSPKSFLPGSHIWMCTLTTEAFNNILAAGDGKRLSAAQVDHLLNPLRQIFPRQSITTSDYEYYYADLNLRDDFGRGAYSDWKIGYSIRQYYEFFGGGPIEPCEHNGCDSNQKWRLHISGAGSCVEETEFVHGAYYAGQRSAKYVLTEMGRVVDLESFKSCEDWEGWQLPPTRR